MNALPAWPPACACCCSKRRGLGGHDSRAHQDSAGQPLDQRRAGPVKSWKGSQQHSRKRHGTGPKAVGYA